MAENKVLRGKESPNGGLLFERSSSRMFQRHAYEVTRLTFVAIEWFACVLQARWLLAVAITAEYSPK
jgi:hypothetical protein